MMTTKTSISDGSKESMVKVYPKPDPLRYLYYRIYTENTALLVKDPAFPDNPYVGRVMSISVAPPQTVLLIKRRLCNAEEISDFSGSTLYLSTSNQSTTQIGERLPIQIPGDVGSTPEEPMELVVKLTQSEKTREENDRVNKMSPKPQHIYYRLYSEDGEIQAKHPHADDCPSIASIDTYLVPPPHSFNSIILYISEAEGFPYCFWHQLFADINGSPINDGDVGIMNNGGPGSVPERPLMFVKSNEMTQRIKPKRIRSDPSPSHDGLLPFDLKHSLCTDGVVRQELLTSRNLYYDGSHQDQLEVFRARNNTTGQQGFVMTSDVL